MLGKERGDKRKNKLREDILHGERLDYCTPLDRELWSRDNHNRPFPIGNHFLIPQFFIVIRVTTIIRLTCQMHQKKQGLYINLFNNIYTVITF